jgi:hypothetical protein
LLLPVAASQIEIKHDVVDKDKMAEALFTIYNQLLVTRAEQNTNGSITRLTRLVSGLTRFNFIAS